MSRVAGKERRKSQVLAAAEASIRKSGTVSFSMKELADKADVSFATPFNLFGKKEDILAALLNSRITQQALSTSERVHKGSGLDTLLHVAVDSCSGYISDSELFRPLLQAMRIRPSPQNRTMSNQATEIWKKALLDCQDDRIIAKDADVEAISRRMHLGFRMAVWMWASEVLSDEEFREQALLHTVACLLPAATPKGKTQINKLATNVPSFSV